jgi:RNA polymerase sigma-70 factor (ECF subfamily)
LWSFRLVGPGVFVFVRRDLLQRVSPRCGGFSARRKRVALYLGPASAGHPEHRKSVLFAAPCLLGRTKTHNWIVNQNRSKSGISESSGDVVTDANVDQRGEGDSTSLSLIKRAQSQDEAAWVRLVNFCDPLLQRWCLQAGLQPADAADVKQEVFAAVARAIGEFRRDRPGDSFRGWLYTITRNKIRDRQRKVPEAGIGGTDAQLRLAAIPADDSDEEPSADPDEERMLYRQALEIIRGEFEPKTWEAFWKVTAEGRSAADVATELGITPNAVYLARSRILHRLRAEFEELIHSEVGTNPPSSQEEEG